MSLNDILEWQAIATLRSHVVLTLPKARGGFDLGALNEDAVSKGNASEDFQFELMSFLSRPDPPLQAVSAKMEYCRAKLVKLVALLDSLAGVQTLGLGPAAGPPGQRCGLRFQNIFGGTEYWRLWTLLEHLAASKSPCNLFKGPIGPAFNMPAGDVVADHLMTVQDVNVLFDLFELSQKGVAQSQTSTTPDVDAVDVGLDRSIREYATAAFNAMFGQLKDCNPAHSAMLYLRSQQDDSFQAPKACLDLFFSSCPHHRSWQEIQCGEREHLELRPRAVNNLCQFITDARRQGRTVHVVGEEIQNITQITQPARHRRDAPKMSLHSMILSDAFKHLDFHHVVPTRFSKTEKRNLVMDITSALSRLLGSNWVGEGWCAKDLFFLGTKTDQARSNTPFGPYITCSAGGPPLADMEHWRPNLDDPPILLFLAKLLLEIDLGTDLDDRIRRALQEDPDDNILNLLVDIHEKYQSDLDYSDAIESCLDYHKIRQAKYELGEITTAPEQWSEWDRRYIQGVVKKLAGPVTEVPPKSMFTYGNRRQHQKENGWHIDRMTITNRSAAEARPHPVSFLGMPPRVMSEQNSDFRLVSSMEPLPSSNPSRNGSTYATLVDLGRRTPNPGAAMDITAEAYHPILANVSHREAKPEAVSQLPQQPLPLPSKNIPLSISGWLDGADQSLTALRGPLDSEPTPERIMMEEDDVGVVFDAAESCILPDHLKEEAKSAGDFWDHMRDFNRRHFPAPPDDDTTGTNGQPARRRRVKIALIDTGVDTNDPFIRPEVERGRIRGRSWVGEDETDFGDSCGHGTHLVRLVLKVSKSADILMAKVSDSTSFSSKNTQNIAEAIRWAVRQDADIISLSLGFRKAVKLIDDALDEAIDPKDKETTPSARPRLVFAAAGNWGGNRPVAFPASRKGAICVHATDGFGYDGQLGPITPDNLKLGNFPIGTLGVTIESAWGGKPVWLKGTSYATPIVAAIAANVLEFGRQHLDNQAQRDLGRFRNMKAVLALMSKTVNSTSYQYCAPWVLYENEVDGRMMTTAQIRMAIEHQLNYY